MPKSNLMERVANDLAKGHTHPAKQRLHSLIAAHPNDLDLRRQLAEIYRQTGDLVQAGRWSYLLEDADPVEVLAFERAYPNVIVRRIALRWPDNALPPTVWVRNRLAELPQLPARISSTAAKLRMSFRLSRVRIVVAAFLCGLAIVGIYSIAERLLR